MYHPAGYIWALSLGVAIGIPALAVLFLRRELSEAGFGTRPAAIALVVVGGWLGTSSLAARFGLYGKGASHAAPWFALAFVGALAGALLAATRLSKVSRAIDAPGALSWLALPHMLRVEGAVFLILMPKGSCRLSLRCQRVWVTSRLGYRHHSLLAVSPEIHELGPRSVSTS